MNRALLTLFCAAQMALANMVTENVWAANRTFYEYLVKNSIDPVILADLDDETYGELKTIGEKAQYYEHRDEEGALLHALIPIGEERQISIYNDRGAYKIEIIPIRYIVVNETLHTRLESSVQSDLMRITGNSRLSTELAAIFDARVDFRRELQKNDALCAVYDRKIRLGRTWGAILVRSAFLEARKNRIYAFYREEDEGYYDEMGNTLASMFIERPIEDARITSHYQPSGRMHPVFGYIRPHLGVDFGAPMGTPIKSVGDGTIRFVGCQKSCAEGYGKMIVVEHRNGWESRYAHLNSFAKIAQGTQVKQSQVIGYVGKSGVTTGTHLHFEMRKSGGHTNPLALKNVRKNGLSGADKAAFLKKARDLKTALDYFAIANEKGVTRLTESSYPSRKNGAN